MNGADIWSLEQAVGLGRPIRSAKMVGNEHCLLLTASAVAFAGSMLLALIGEGRKLALVHPGIDWFGSRTCYGSLHLRLGILKRNGYPRQLPVGLGFTLRLALLDPQAVGPLTYSLFQIVAHNFRFRLASEWRRPGRTPEGPRNHRLRPRSPPLRVWPLPCRSVRQPSRWRPCRAPLFFSPISVLRLASFLCLGERGGAII